MQPLYSARDDSCIRLGLSTDLYTLLVYRSVALAVDLDFTSSKHQIGFQLKYLMGKGLIK